MKGKMFRFSAILAGAVWVFIGSIGCKSSEQPEKTPEGPVPKITAEELAGAVEVYIKRGAISNDGYFEVYDKEAKKPLRLKLEAVHRGQVHMVGEDAYFAGADFKTDDGKTFELDFFVQGTAPDNLFVGEILVHKENGTARYGWVKKKGIWKREAPSAESGQSGTKKPASEESGKKEPPPDKSGKKEPSSGGSEGK